MILSSGIAVLVEYSKTIEKEGSLTYESLVKDLQGEVRSEKILVRTNDGKVVEGANELANATGFLIFFSNGTAIPVSSGSVLRVTEGSITIDPVLLQSLSSGEATLFAFRPDGSFLRIDSRNIASEIISNGSSEASALISFAQYMLGADAAYKIFMVENKGVNEAVVESYRLPFEINVTLYDVRPVLIKTSNGCPQGQYRIERWGVRAKYNALLIVNGNVYKNESGNLLLTTSTYYTYFAPSYKIEVPEAKLNVSTTLPQTVYAKITTYFKFSMRAPTPFVCTNTWTIYYPDYHIEVHLNLRIYYNGTGKPMLIIDKNNLHLLGGKSQIELSNYYRSVGNLTVYYNSTDNIILDLHEKRSESYGYYTRLETSDPTITYLLGILS